MDRFIPSMVKTQKIKFDAGFRQLGSKRKSWEELAKNAVEYFEKIKKECEEKELFEAIYVVDSRKREDSKNYLPHITLFFGQHPLGYREFKSKGLAVEGGCSLVISQSVLGDVIAIYYPFESDLAQMPEEYLIANVYSAPWAVTDSELEKLANKFFSYAQVSSVYGYPSSCDKASVFFMRVHHWWLHFKITEFLVKVIAEVSKASLKKVMSGGT